MLTIARLFVAVLGLTQVGVSQIAQITETRTKTQDAPGWANVEQNDSKNSLVAIHIRYYCPDRQHSTASPSYQNDALFAYGNDHVIAPGGHISFPGATYQGLDCPGGVDGVIFSDGTSGGDPSVVKEMYARRRGAYDAINIVIPLLQPVAAGKSEPESVVRSLSAQMNAQRVDMTMDPMEREGRKFVFSIISTLLQRQVDFSVPSDLTLNHQPSSVRLMTERNIPKAQAHAIILSKKLQEWSSDLELHRDPPK